MPLQDLLTTPSAAPITVALESAHNALHSLVLLTKAETTSGLGEWVVRTAGALTPQERQRHRLVTIGFYYAVLPEESWPAFPTYLDHLATCRPHELRDKMLAAYARLPLLEGVEREDPAGEPAAVLRSTERYLAFLRTRFCPDSIDEALESEAYRYVSDPAAMQELIVPHLRKMWDEFLASEWARVEPMLRDAVQAFEQVDLNRMSRFEAAQLVVGRELERELWEPVLEEVERVVFVPSAHIGPYLGKARTGNTLWIFFGARLPRGSALQSPELSQAELLVRLDALADDTRLRILRLIAEEGEQRSQEIMARLGLGQSTASRHLHQLSAAGYLVERRCDGAKCYTFNPRRLEDTLQAISSLLLTKGAEEKR